MKHGLRIWICCFLATVASSSSFATADLDKEAARFSKMYYAPMDGFAFSRLYDPSLGVVEFERAGGGRVLRGAAGWHGRVDERYVTVVKPNENGKEYVEYKFKNGHPHILTVGGKSIRIEVEDGAVAYRGVVPELWNEDTSEEASPLKRKWKGRWKGFYRNPNITGALMSLLGLTFVALIFFPSVSRFKWIFLPVSAALAVWFCRLLFLTQSRGGMLSFLAGLAVMVVIRVRRLQGKSRTVSASILGVLAIGGIAAAIVGGLHSAWLADPGNALRISIFKIAPRMMVDAPWGWSFFSPGEAYTGWYQAVSSSTVAWTLVSSHLTELVALGWPGRFFWLFFWFLIPVVLFRHAWKGGSVLPCVLWVAFSVSAIFNPIFRVWSLWILPALAFVFFIFECGLKNLRVYQRDAICCAAVAAVAALFCWNVGCNTPSPDGIRLHTDSKSVLVAGDNPLIWIVDDGISLGWKLTSRDIRNFYRHVKNTPPIGYTKSLSAVPKDVGRLVLAGVQCRAYIEAWQKGIAPIAREVYFISPPFGPSAIPSAMQRSVSIAVVLGEFATRYVDVYGSSPLPEWVTVVPGAECYIPGWVSLVIGE